MRPMGIQEKWVQYQEFNFRYLANILIKTTSGQLDILANGELWEMEGSYSTLDSIFVLGICMPSTIQ